MNDNIAAQAATPSVLTEAERRQLLVRANYPPLQEEPRAYLVKITEELVLSKLRAPVADERAAFEADYAKAWNAAEGNKVEHTASDVAKLREGDGYGHGLDYLNGRWAGWQARADLASAPVARSPVCAPTWEEVKEANSVLASYSWNSNGEGGGVTATERKLAAALLRVAGVDWNPNGDPIYALRAPGALIQTLIDEKVDPKYWAESLRLRALARAPVADERAAFARSITGRDDLEPYQVENVIDANGARWKTWQDRAALASAPVAEQAALSAQSATKDDKAALGLPECGKPLCAPGEHHPLCRHGWAEKKAASAPVAGDGKTRVPGDQLGGPAAAWDDGAQSDPNWPESRASIESKGGALAPVAGEAVNLQAAREYLDQWGCLADPNVRALLENAERAAPQASEAVRDGTWPMLSELHLHALMFAYNEGYSKAYDGRLFPNPFSENGSQAAAWQLGTDDGTEARAALSAQPADKPAISSPSSAGNPCPAPVPAYPQTGKSHTDGGAVYG